MKLSATGKVNILLTAVLLLGITLLVYQFFAFLNEGLQLVATAVTTSMTGGPAPRRPPGTLKVSYKQVAAGLEQKFMMKDVDPLQGMAQYASPGGGHPYFRVLGDREDLSAVELVVGGIDDREGVYESENFMMVLQLLSNIFPAWPEVFKDVSTVVGQLQTTGRHDVRMSLRRDGREIEFRYIRSGGLLGVVVRPGE